MHHAGFKCYLVWRVVNRTRQLRLKFPLLSTINFPREKISGVNLTAKAREESRTPRSQGLSYEVDLFLDSPLKVIPSKKKL